MSWPDVKLIPQTNKHANVTLSDIHGAATCTGDGDLMLRFCPTHRVVQQMAHGASPQQACELTVHDISQRLKDDNFEMGIIALNKEV